MYFNVIVLGSQWEEKGLWTKWWPALPEFNQLLTHYIYKYFTGLSVSLASLYSEADLSKYPLPRTGTEVVSETVLSAEGVALSLLRRFSEKHLPRASDLEWLVSEQDAPQQVQFCELLLGLSSSIHICSYYDRKMGFPVPVKNCLYDVRSSHDMLMQVEGGGGGIAPAH